MRIDQIGGGRVIRSFTIGNERVHVGSYLTQEQIAKIPAANRSCLIGRFIDVWPKASDGAGFASSSPDQGADRAERRDRHVVALGFGHGYSVIDGVWLNDKPIMSRAEAYALAGKPDPKAPKKPKRGKEH